MALGKTSPPQYTRLSTEKALAGLRRARAERWAPDLSRTAERAVRDAVAEYGRQEATFVSFRNFDQARAMLRAAEDQVRQAQRVAADERKRIHGEALAAIDDARRIVDATNAVAGAMHINGYDRKLLQRSLIAVKEAEILLRNEDYAGARQRAELAGIQAARVTERAATLAARFTDPSTIRNWKRMIAETVEWSRATGSSAVVVSKEAHRLTLYDNGREVKSFKVEVGFNSIRDKLHAGDNATPEGKYRITAKKGLGNSRYHKALLLNYPNEEDRAHLARMKRAGQVPRNYSPGSLIEIHGEGGRGKDWTNGCVALPNREMDDLFARVGVGTPVTIVGGDGNGGRFTELARTRAAAAARAN
jgi:lipoprotein-anchoring transpeptidase ErfK/SrfK